MVTQDQTLKGLLNELIEKMTRLVRGEFRLVRAETHEKVAQLQTGTIAILSGLLLAFADYVFERCVLKRGSLLLRW